MALVDCGPEATCADCVENTCLEFSDGPAWPAAQGVNGPWSLPSYGSIVHSPVVNEAPEHRYGGRKGTCGKFDQSICPDTRRMNWVVTFPFCKSDPHTNYLKQGECWRFRHYPDCNDKTVYWELIGRVSFDQDVTFDNDTNDVTLVTFTIKGRGDHQFFPAANPANRTTNNICTPAA